MAVPTERMARLSRIRVLAVVILLATAFAVFAFQERNAAQAAVGRPAPDFALRDQGGRIWRLDALRGHVVFLNFWTSWCTVCRHEAPALETFYRRYSGRMVLLGIDWREPESAITRYLQQFGITYPNLRDADGSVAQAYRLTGVPESWLIGRHGVARVHWVGGMTFEEMRAAYEKAAGRSIDAAGVGPVSAGERARALLVRNGGQTIWIGTDHGLWVSTDAGRSWSAPAGLPPGHAVAALAAQGGTMYAAGPELGLWRGASGGRIWTDLTRSLPSAEVAAVAASPTRLYAWLAGRGLYASSDGTRWRRIAPADALPAAPTALLAPGGGTPALLATTPKGVYRSGDAGRRWSPAGINQEVQNTNELASPLALPTYRVPLAAAGEAASGKTVFLAGPDGVWRGGKRLAGSPARTFDAVAVDAGRIFALAPNGDVYESDVAGRAWHRLRFGSPGGGGGR